MKKIIHISDLHVGFENYGDRFSEIIRNLIFEKGDKPNEYVIVITGDIAHNANDMNCYDGVKTGIDNLNQAGFNNVLVVPGNHDYGTGSHGDKKFVNIFKQIFFGENLEYPKKDIIDGIAFIGLDSMAEELHWYDTLFSQGELGDRQLSKLKEIVFSNDVSSCQKRVIYLHHHPFDPWPLHQLKDSEKLQNILSNIIDSDISIDAMLYGHNHAGEIHNGKWKILRCYDAGSTTLKPRPKYLEWLPFFKVKAATRVIHLDYDVSKDYELSLL